ncbi:MAG: zinc ribbon domain-containing protein [Anaerolineae bacterium]|nr:zinc ribbon domain-containing protein [Anaerolineae bacterium]
MPLYEYACQTCGARFERVCSAARADEPAACQSCGGTEVRRLLSRFAAFSKGSAGSHAVGGGCGSCAGGNCATCRTS